MKKIIFIILIISIYNISYSQKKLNITEIDKITYQQYLDKNWNELIQTGTDALKNNISFYYLHVRLGIAYYEQKKYAQAIKYFEKANELNPEDELIQEYLYYSYLFSGNYEEARLFKYSLSNTLAEKLKINKENPIIRALYIETKHNFYEDHLSEFDSLNSFKQVTRLDRSYYNLSIEHDIGKTITIFHGYSYVGISNLVSDNTDVSLPPQYYEEISQNEYYLSLKVRLAKRLNLITAIHYLKVKTSSQGEIEIPGIDIPGPGPGPSGGNSQYYMEIFQTNENFFVGFIKLERSFSLLRTGISTSISNLNGSLQFQPEFSFKLYPFGNANVVCESSIINLIQNNQNFYSLVFKQSIGLNMFKYFWLEPSFTYGNMINFTEFNGFVANNDLDVVKYRFETLFNISLAKRKFNIFAKYQYNAKENEYEINNNDQQIQFDDHSITAGIKWYFNKNK